MAGLSPKLPLLLDKEYGVYKVNKTYIEMIKQNFKHLLLTIPGERMMDPGFGVGLIKFLFEQDTVAVRGGISDRIERQLAIYMPFVELLEIDFIGFEDHVEAEPGTLNMKIKYRIPNLNVVDLLEISVT
tara:strand:+ start:1627 stop:2013 length:387 start_codon:yes stop_codon:yes gene_type:complete